MAAQRTRTAAAKAQEAPDAIAEYFGTHGVEGLISTEQLATLVSVATGTERSGKTIRAHLRKMGARDQVKERGNRWVITPDVARLVIGHYTKASKVVKAS